MDGFGLSRNITSSATQLSDTNRKQNRVGEGMRQLFAAQRYAVSVLGHFKNSLIIQSANDCDSMFVCTPYGLSVRVNAKEALPDELKYKDWDAKRERANQTQPGPSSV